MSAAQKSYQLSLLNDHVVLDLSHEPQLYLTSPTALSSQVINMTNPGDPSSLLRIATTRAMAQRLDLLANQALEEENATEHAEDDLASENAAKATYKVCHSSEPVAQKIPEKRQSSTQEVFKGNIHAYPDGRYLQSIAGQALALMNSGAPSGSITTDSSRSNSVCQECLNSGAPCSVLNKIFGRR
jgi:hypothetical protein